MRHRQYVVALLARGFARSHLVCNKVIQAEQHIVRQVCAGTWVRLVKKNMSLVSRGFFRSNAASGARDGEAVRALLPELHHEREILALLPQRRLLVRELALYAGVHTAVTHRHLANPPPRSRSLRPR